MHSVKLLLIFISFVVLVSCDREVMDYEEFARRVEYCNKQDMNYKAYKSHWTTADVVQRVDCETEDGLVFPSRDPKEQESHHE